MLERTTREGVELLVVPELEREGVTVAFSQGGRTGDDHPCEGNNLSFDAGDAPEAVARNRKSLALALGVESGRMALGRQVHGAAVRRVGELDVGRGARDYDSGLARTDGLVTTLPGVAIGVLTADCVPLALAAPAARAPGVAVAHCGWRGVLAGTGVGALMKLARAAGCEPGEIHAVIGPHIRRCCFETGPEIAREFERRFGAAERASGGRWFVDLGLACASQLLEAGVRPERVQTAVECTCCDGRYYSYRGSGNTRGRQGGFAVVRGG